MFDGHNSPVTLIKVLYIKWIPDKGRETQQCKSKKKLHIWMKHIFTFIKYYIHASIYTNSNYVYTKKIMFDF